jgi:hypothetical protein
MDTSTPMSSNELRDRSYRVRETIPEGSTVRLIQAAYFGGPLAAGTVATVRRYSNDGFNGIHAHLYVGETYIGSHSAGLLALAK